MSTPTDITDLSTTAASNSPAGSEAPSVLDNEIRALASIIKQNVTKGADIASAGTITIPNVGNYFVVTGTTGITGIDDAWNGRVVYLKFSGILTLTNSASLILFGANITTAAGDSGIFVNESAGVWRCLAFTQASGSYITADSTDTLTNKTIVAANNTLTIASTDLTDTADLTYNADTDVSGNGWVVDEDNMASDLATKVPTQQSVKAYVDTYLPAGAVQYFAMNSPPTGWLECDGSAVSRATYSTLFAAIGTTFGVGDGSTTFELPDLRGEFIRGWDNGKGTDSGRTFGSSQADEYKSHTHGSTKSSIATAGAAGAAVNVVTGFVASGASGGAETRPTNIALLPCIKV